MAPASTDSQSAQKETFQTSESSRETQLEGNADPSVNPYSGFNMAAAPSHILNPQHKNFINTKCSSGRESPLYFENISPHTSNFGHLPQSLSSPLSTTSVTQRSASNQQRDPANNNAAPSCLLPTPVRPTNAVLVGDNRARGQSVSFCDPDASEKSRRFTISAQPSNASLTTSSRQNSFQMGSSRKPSLNGEVPHGPSRTSSALAFQCLNRSDIPPNSPYASSRVETTISSQTKTSPLTNNGNATFSPDLPPTLSGRSSRQGSDVGSQPIPISRKTSISKKSNKTLVASPVGPPVPFQQFLLKEDDKKVHILLACTGSVATIKVPLIIDRLFQIFGTSKISVQLVVTKCAGHFLKGLKIRKDVKIWRDEDEWANFSEWNLNSTTTLSTFETKKQKNPHDKMILHNELRKWADIMLLAPLSANTLAKIAHGISDNLLTSILRSWGTLSGSGGQIASKKPIIVAPAMNTFMYTHPLTGKQLKILASNEEGFGMEVLKPVEKVLVCGDIGMGGMREWSDIVETMRKKIKIIFAERQSAEGVQLSLDERDDEDGDEDEDDKDEGEDDEDEDEDDEDDEDEDEDDEDDEDDQNDSQREDQEFFGPADGDEDTQVKEKVTSRKDLRGEFGEQKPVGMIDLEKKQDALKSKNKGLLFELSGDRNSEDVQRTMSPANQEAKNIL
ncbi:hypothetical protein JCM33374_g403 [Metschnikowia sp. JCM 33374]|nr:hypothetical protein JCM33374_g403 [Metschnikowia sp. JCM 33374]